MFRTINEYLENTVVKYRGDTAICELSNGKVLKITYDNLWLDVIEFAKIIEINTSFQENVALIGTASYRWLVSFFAVTLSGRVAVIINHALSEIEINEHIAQSDSTTCLFTGEVGNPSITMKQYKESTNGNAVFCEKNVYPFCQKSETNIEQGAVFRKVSSDMLATIIFTSGTTGKPKGVMLSHGNLAKNISCRNYGVPGRGNALCILPPHHVYALVVNYLFSLSQGLTICICDEKTSFMNSIRVFNPYFIAFVPSMMRTLGKLLVNSIEGSKDELRKKIFGENLTYICCGGAYLNTEIAEIFERFEIGVYQGYGMTETTGIATANVYNKKKLDSVGTPQPICNIRIKGGEVQVRGQNVMLGYYKMPEETKLVFDGDWLKTGDQGYIDEDGFLHITGRKKTMIITSNGENISPEEMEEQLLCNELIQEVVIRQNADFIECEIFPNMSYALENRIIDIETRLNEIINAFNDKQPSFKHIRRVIVRYSEFEKTSNGRIRRGTYIFSR